MVITIRLNKFYADKNTVSGEFWLGKILSFFGCYAYGYIHIV